MRQPTSEQQAIIDSDRDILLRAAAGTGKTFTVARKISNALSGAILTPDRILCLTFTKKAAQEMAEDIAAETNGEQITVSTIHGFCYRLIESCSKLLGVDAHPNVCDEVDAEELLKNRVLKEMNDLFGKYSLKKQGFENREHTTIVKSVSGEYFYHVKGEDEDVLISAGGESYAAQRVKLSQQFSCPFCNRMISENALCPHCGGQLSECVLPTVNPQINLYRIVSKVRHYREFYGIHSDSDKKDFQETYARLISEFPEEMRRLYAIDKYEQDGFERFAPKWIGALTERYIQELRLCGLCDFDDLLLLAVQALSDEETATNFRHRYRLLVVDEVQDTSRLEYAVISQLFGENQVVFCGDCNQSVYSWRGAEPNEIIKEFIDARHPVEMTLTENLRSSAKIVDAANAFLTYSFSEEMPEKEATDSNAPIELHRAETPESQAEYIYRALEKIDGRGRCCVLARNNYAIKTFYDDAVSFQNGENPVRFIKGEEEKNFFKRAEVKDYLSIFRLLVNGDDNDALERFAVSKLGMTRHALRGIRTQSCNGLAATDFLNESERDPFTPLFEALNSGNCVVFDLETTGLDVTKDEAIQIAAIKIDANGKEKERYLCYVQTDRPITLSAQQTHGITEETLKSQGLKRDVAIKSFADFCKDCVVTGYNSGAFDVAMMKIECLRYNVDFQISRHYDVMTIAKRLLAGLKNYKLSTLCETLQIVNEHAHDALSDVFATAQILNRLTKILIQTTEKREKYRAKIFPELTELGQNLALWRPRVFVSNDASVLAEIGERYFARNNENNAVESVFRRLTASNECLYQSFLQLNMRTLDGNRLWRNVMTNENAVSLLTVHQAKGCEFDTVFILDCDNKNFPNYRSVAEGGERGKTEEIHIFYVALTRAKNKVVAVYAASRFNAKFQKRLFSAESPYFSLIPARYILRT